MEPLQQYGKKFWLLNSISNDISTSVINCNLAGDIWLDLKKRFSQLNDTRMFQLEQDISNLVQATIPFATYFTKLKEFWDELSALQPNQSCTYGELKEVVQLQQYQRTMKFLMGLNELYVVVCGHVFLMEPLSLINRAYALVLQEEHPRGITTPSVVEGIALATRGNLPP
jgi:hypothetical protein